MPPQTLEFPPQADEGAEYVDNTLISCCTHRNFSGLRAQNSTAPQRTIIEPSLPRPQTNGPGDWASSEPAEYFEGISPEKVKIMMELMRSLVGTTKQKVETLPVQSIRLRLRTLMTQAAVAESSFDQLGAVKYIVKAVECRRRILSITPNEGTARRYHLASFSDALFLKFERLGDMADINQAIQCLSQAIQLTPDGNSNKQIWFDKLGTLYTDRFVRMNELADGEKAIECHTRAVQLTPDDHPNKPNWFNNLGNSYLRRFERLGELADVDKAIECHTEAVQLTPDGHPAQPIWLTNLGSAYRNRFERLGELADVDKAIECQTQAVQLTPDGHQDKPRQLNSLGSSYLRRFERLGELADVDKAIEYQTRALQLTTTTDGHPKEPSPLNNLGSSYMRRFERFGELVDMDRAIEYQTQGVQLTPDGDPHKPSWLNNLGNSYLSRFKRFGKLADVNEAIQFHTQAVQLTPDDHLVIPSWLNNLGKSYLSRFEHLGEVADIDKAIECQSQAVQLSPEGHPDKLIRLNNLGNSYCSRFKRLDGIADMGKAIECHTRALQLTPDGHPDKPSHFSNLGESYLCRFERLGELTDMEKAIECHTEAVQLSPHGRPEKPGWLNNLGNSYRSQFERLGELADMDKAIECHIQAVQLTPDGHPDQPIWLNNLGSAYRNRFARLGELADVAKAIECHTQAVQLTPAGHQAKLSHLNNLGSSYMRRFEHLGELEDADKAIEYQTQAVQLTPNGHPIKSGRLNNLGISYMRRFEHLGELVDVDKAIECQTSAVQLTPDDDHPGKSSRLDNLGNSYMYRFERLAKLADVDKAIECQIQAVQLTPDGHSHKPGRLNNLGGSYMRRFEHLGELTDLTHAQSIFQQGAQLVSTSPESQLQCARYWAKTSSLLGLSPQGAYERCIKLLPHLIWLGTTISHRYSLLTKVNDLATEVAAWAISVQSYDLAIEWLEEGRSIVWNQILQLRTPFEQLSTVDFQLAQQLKNIASELEYAGSRPAAQDTLIGMDSDLEMAAQHHRRLAAEWEHCLEQARSIPGFYNFMRPQSATELKAAATDGPVIIINTHSTRWDALIIFPQCDDIVHVPLNKPSLNEAGRSHAQPYPGCVAGHRGEKGRGFGRARQGPESEDPFKSSLVALWSEIVKPILDVLGCEPKLSVVELPHVTWCATGSLASIPLHAAGPYGGSWPNAFDLVISSYTPSLGALLASSATPSQPESGLLAVGQESTRGHFPLPNTVQELEAINAHAHVTRFLQLDGENASVDAVLSAMDQHSWVHLACHATQNAINPTHSAFHLSDGDLTLESITKHQFRNKGLAFLSACQTAKGDGELPDEAVHLAAGMLMAGYPSVIATMWSIWDADGPEVAGRVYAELFKEGKMDHRGAARALHKAVAGLRDKIGEGQFERWVPFIHIGV